MQLELTVKKSNNITIYAIVGLMLFTFCSKEVTKETKKEEEQILPEIVQYNYKHYIYKNSKKYLIANIKVAQFFEKKKEINCDGIYAEIYNGKGELTTTINADKANINKETKKVTFSENVIFDVIDNKIKLFTEEITLDYAGNKLFSKGEVLIKKEDGSFIKGDSMESDIKNAVTKFEKMIIKYYYDDEKKD